MKEFKVFSLKFILSIAGATLPYTAVSIGLTASLVAGSVGIAGGYIGASAANKNMDPTKWDWTSPKTYGGFFEGFTTGFNIASGFAGKAMTKEFVKLAILPAAAGAYYKGSMANQGKMLFWEWQWDSEGMAVTFGEMLDGFGTVFAVTSTTAHVENFKLGEFTKDPISGVKQLLVEGKKAKISNLLDKLPKPVASRIAGLVAGTIAAGQVVDFFDIDFENFKHNERGTYEALINGFCEGKEAYSKAMDLQNSRVDISIQERMKDSSGRSKRSAEWRITLTVDPKIFQHEVVPQMIAQVQPELKKNQITAVDESSGYIIPTETSFARSFVDRIPSDEKSFNFNSSFNVLQMGDHWLQQTSTVSNLTLLNLLVEKFFGSKKHKKDNKKLSKTNVEYQLITSEIVNEFVEAFLQHAEDCGISDYVMNEIFEKSINLSSLNAKVEKEIRRKDFLTVSKIIMDEMASKFLHNLKNLASNDQINKLQILSSIEAAGIEKKLEKFEETAHELT